MGVRLVALDLDGTALDPSGSLRPAVERCVARVRERGIRVVITTGRRFRTGRPFAERLGLAGPCVFHHGALVKEVASGETRARHDLPDPTYRAAVAALGRLGPPIVFVDGFPDREDMVTTRHARAHPAHDRYLADNRTAHRLVDDLEAPTDGGALVVALMGEERRLGRLRAELDTQLGDEAVVGIHPSYAGGHLLELLPAGVSKWSALRTLAAEAGIAPPEILAIGDEMNDVEMLRHAGLGVAMGNARPAVKDVADHVTATNAEDGVAVARERFVLQT
ncbi:MAG: HAD family phosphatase [Deltaproteobacteria bacterium]|nr:MAG: HAD family phosphatase [Deltaproteobacteria bacterium]